MLVLNGKISTKFYYTTRVVSIFHATDSPELLTSYENQSCSLSTKICSPNKRMPAFHCIGMI